MLHYLCSFGLNQKFLFFFLLLAQNALSTFCLDAKSSKKIKPGPKLRRPGKPTHMNNLYNL
jgi:hypothetical protein